ncbi:MAG: hypothetical protein MJZ16_07380 [Bacteroidales bacterium]|nr:hypothetical protein [Bacteroidales bacterium]
MKKSEMFSIVLGKVAEVCEVREESIINGSKMQAVVDARILAVQYLRRIGLTNDDIALIIYRISSGDMNACPTMSDLKKKARNIDRLFCSYSQRCLESYAFCLMSKEIKEFCHEKYSEHYLGWMKDLPKHSDEIY